MRICYVIRSETLRNHVFWTSYFPEEKSNMFTVIYERIRSQIRKIMKSLDELKRIVSEDPFKGGVYFQSHGNSYFLFVLAKQPTHFNTFYFQCFVYAFEC